MHAITHPEMVAALVKPGAVIVAGMTPEECDLWHGATGVAGETGEILEAVLRAAQSGEDLDHENMVEELGDMEFYLQQVRANLGIDREETVPLFGFNNAIGPLFDHAAALAIAGCMVLDQAKKVAIYKKPAAMSSFIHALTLVESEMEALRIHCGVTREETLDHNISKLSVRYAGLAYSDSAAQARADKQGE